MTNRIKANSRSDHSRTIADAGIENEHQNKVESHKKEVRNPVVEAQKQMSSQETVGVFSEEQT